MATDYNVVAETTIRALDDDTVDEVLDALADYAGVLGRSPRGRTHVTITLPAASLRQAITTALSVIEDAIAPARVASLEAMTTKEFDARSDAIQPPRIPELLTITEAAAALGVSRQAVHQRIETGSLPATRVGSTWVLPREVVIHEVPIRALAIFDEVVDGPKPKRRPPVSAL